MTTARRARRGLAVLAATGLASGAAGVPAATGQEPVAARLPVTTVSLANGMDVLVLPRPGVPTTAFVVWFDVGGADEHLGITGVAHLLEHLLFKGTTTIGTRDVEAEGPYFDRMDAAQDTLDRARTRGDSAAAARLRERIHALEDSARTLVVQNEFDEILSRAGARGLNATTTNDATIYFVELPSNRIETWFLLEADRMRNPVFREFYTERDVVMEERRLRVDSSPGGLLYEAHLAAAFTVHPYGVPVVGWMSDLRQLGRSDVKTHYEAFYGPANVTVAIVGDLDVEQVRTWIDGYFAPIPGGPQPRRSLAVEPPQRGERRVEVEFDAEPALRIGWHVPAADHSDTPALAVLASLLTGGLTSRLHRRLVLDERLAVSVSAGLGPGDDHPRLFHVDAAPRAPYATSDVEAAIYEEIAGLVGERPPAASEIQRIRNQIRAGEVRRLRSNLGLAFQLASAQSAYGSWETGFRLTDRLLEVTPADVRRVAREYLRRSNRTVATLVRPVVGRHP